MQKLYAFVLFYLLLRQDICLACFGSGSESTKDSENGETQSQEKQNACPQVKGFQIECVKDVVCARNGTELKHGMTDDKIICPLGSSNPHSYGVCCFIPQEEEMDYFDSDHDCGMQSPKIQHQQDISWAHFPMQYRTPIWNDSMPFMVNIKVVYEDIATSCGGVMISGWHVLTAAHCVEEERLDLYIITAGHLHAGANFQDQDIYLEQRGVNKVEVNAVTDADLAVITMTAEVHYGDFTSIGCLPYNFNLDDVVVTRAEWSLPDSFPEREVVPQNMQVRGDRTLSASRCQRALDELFEHPVPGVYPPSRDASHVVCVLHSIELYTTCGYQTGGPLLWRDLDYQKYYIVGVVTRGNNCERVNIPSLFTKVFPYVNWINNVISEI